MGVYVVEIVAAIDSIGTTTTLYYSSGGFTTSPTDTPANTFFDPRLKQPALMTRNVFTQGTTTGQSSVGYGEIVLVNNDGGLDGLINYGFDGRSVTVRFGEIGSTYPSGFVTLLKGTMEQAELTWNAVAIKVRDRQAEFANKQIQTTKYAGNNSLPNGLEGVAGDLKGKPKPICYGKVYNISPPCVNTSRLIYQVNDGAVSSVDYVYDRGVSLTKGADYTSQSDMETNSPAAGNFRVWPGGGYFRFGSSPAGQVTADVVQGAAASNRTVAQIIKSIAIDRGGLLVGDVVSADVTALDSDNSSEVGIYIDSETSLSGPLDELANSVGAWWGFDSSGQLRMERIESPSGAPVTTLTPTEVINFERVGSSDPGRSIPAYLVKLKYKKFYTVQDSDLAGSVTDARRAEIKEEFREVTATDSAVKTKHLLSPELEFQTLLVDPAAAATEATRLLNMYKVHRDVVTCRVHLDTGIASVVDLGDVLSVSVPRFGFDSGKLFKIIGIQSDLKRNFMDLTLWG